MSGHNCLHLAGLGALLIALSSGCIEKRSFQPVIPPPPSVPTARLPQNNAYLGSVHSPRPGALQPRFAWTAATTDEDDPLTYKLELSANRDFSGEVFEYTTEDTSFSPPSPLAVSTVPPVGRRYFWRVRACLPLICSEPSAVRWINLGRSDHDYNGDGYADVLVGAPNNDDAGQNAGKAYVYFGGASANFDAIPDGVLANSIANSRFGESVATAGDFDGDGFADVIVGAPLAEGAGRAYLYFGAAGSMFDTTPDLVLNEINTSDYYGAAVSAAGDFDGDGFADLAIGAPGETTNPAVGGAFLYLGNAQRQKPSGSRLALNGVPHHEGARVSLLGDIDNDGLSDIAIGDTTNTLINVAADCSSNLYLGRRAPTMLVTQSESRILPGRGCKLIWETAGDVNGDGFSDILEAFGTAEVSGFSQAVVTVQLGNPGHGVGAGGTALLPKAHSMRALGDINGDGFDDFTLGKFDTAVTVDIYFGAAQLPPFLRPAVMLVGPQGTFGAALSGAGDLNGDGLSDLVIGDHGINSSRGSVTIYYGVEGSHPFSDSTIDGMLDAGAASSAFGFSVASLGGLQFHQARI